MTQLPGSRRWFRLPAFNRARITRDIDDEFRFHFDMRVAELIARGAAPDDAREEALRRFGDSHDAQEYCRTMDERAMHAARRRDRLGSLAQDVRWALRQTVRSPAFTALAVITLGLGIGATTAVFSTINRLLFNPLPFPGGDRIVSLARQMPNGGFYLSASPDNVRAWRERVAAFEQVAGVYQREVVFGEGADVVELEVGEFEPHAAQMVHMRPVLGRTFDASDTEPDAPRVVMLGEGLWKQRFGGRRDALNATVRLDGELYTVVGVAPASFELPAFASAPASKELWLPLGLHGVDTPLQSGWRRSIGAIALLREGANKEQVEREMTVVIAQQQPDGLRTQIHGVMRRPQDFIASRTQEMLYVLLGAVAVVLLIGCANVANLLLARAAGRERELAVRRALGAGRGRVVRQQLTESAALALMGGAVGLVVAQVSLRIIIGLRPNNLTELDRVTIDPAAAAVAFGLALATGLLFGLAPVLHASEDRLGRALYGGLRTGSRTAGLLRATLIVGEIALSLTLLIGAGLLVRSLRSLQHVDVGFDTAGVTSVRLEPPDDSATAEVHLALMQEMARRAGELPGVRGATLTMGLPGQMGVSSVQLQLDGRDIPESGQVGMLGANWARPGYFRMLGLPIIAGSVYEDIADPNTLVISETMAKQFWPGQSAVGQRLRLTERGGWMTVIGVVGDIRFPGARSSASTMQIYWPFEADFRGGSLLMRVDENAQDVLAGVTGAVHAVDPRWKVRDLETMDASLARLLTGPRFSAALLGLFAGVAALLTIVGLYGVVAYTVAQRTREMGIRMALGATSRDVWVLVVAHGARMAAVGIGLGLALAFAATRLLRAQLHGVSAVDPATFVGVAALLGVVTLLASYVPARRATRVDPVVAVRTE